MNRVAAECVPACWNAWRLCPLVRAVCRTSHVDPRRAQDMCVRCVAHDFSRSAWCKRWRGGRRGFLGCAPRKLDGDQPRGLPQSAEKRCCGTQRGHPTAICAAGYEWARQGSTRRTHCRITARHYLSCLRQGGGPHPRVPRSCHPAMAVQFTCTAGRQPMDAAEAIRTIS